jgi:hypothetical protein
MLTHVKEVSKACRIEVVTPEESDHLGDLNIEGG